MVIFCKRKKVWKDAIGDWKSNHKGCNDTDHIGRWYEEVKQYKRDEE